jgi:predicted Na+-dependent transporter
MTIQMSNKTMIWIVIGKMIIMPFIGILTALILRTYFWDIPDDIDGAFYLVLMIVFITPTANNVMVMVELSGSNSKEAIARVIALQYAVSPLILSLTMTVAIGVASNWS